MNGDMGELNEQMNEMDYAKLISYTRTWFPNPIVISAIVATVAIILFQRHWTKEMPKHKDVNGSVENVEPGARAAAKTRCEGKIGDGCCKEKGGSNRGLKILYGTNTGTAAAFAKKLGATASASGIQVTDVSNIKDCDAEETFANADKASVLVFVLSTYTDGSPPPDAVWFCTWVKEAANDFRYQHSMLKNIKYCVFALGHSDYGDKAFCTGK